MRRCAWLALAALLALAACGGSGHARLSKADYQAKLRSAFRTAFVQVQTHDTASPAFLKSIASAYEGIASDLKGVRAPRDVQTLNDRLVAAASAKAVSLKRLVNKLDRASPAERQRLLAEYEMDLADFDSAVEALQAKGYRFKPSAGT